MPDKEVPESSFFVGFLIGAFVGIAFGFLYAPRLRVGTQKLLREKAKKMREKTLTGQENC
jgi:gas vesicle protein